jgi:SNF family Na+-dependent transporter
VVAGPQHGGLVFLLMYTAMLVLLGGPLLLLEFFLGQYSGSTSIEYRPCTSQ